MSPQNSHQLTTVADLYYLIASSTEHNTLEAIKQAILCKMGNPYVKKCLDRQVARTFANRYELLPHVLMQEAARRNAEKKFFYSSEIRNLEGALLRSEPTLGVPTLLDVVDERNLLDINDFEKLAKHYYLAA